MKIKNTRNRKLVTLDIAKTTDFWIVLGLLAGFFLALDLFVRVFGN